MKQLTIRGYDDELERRIRKLARVEGISLNQAALRLLRRGAGLTSSPDAAVVIGSGLDDLIGTWTDAEHDEMMRLVEGFEQIDERLWK